MGRIIVLTLAAAGVALTFAAHAQAPTAEGCKAAVEKLNSDIDAAVNLPQKDQLLLMSDQASDAHDQGRYQECMDIVAQAEGILANK